MWLLPPSLPSPNSFFSQLNLVAIQQRQRFIGLPVPPYRQFKLGQKLSAFKITSVGEPRVFGPCGSRFFSQRY
jgi:hypothetical protein